jgi:hypothetical protein
MRVLIACECSGRVREAFAARGWEAWSADLLPSEIPPRRDASGQGITTHFPSEGKGSHYTGDVRDLFNWNHRVNENRSMEERRGDYLLGSPYYKPKPRLWDLIIAHPPCTDLSYAGARWFKLKDADRGGDGSMQAAAEFFREMLNSPSDLVAVENPHSIIQQPRFKVGPAAQVVEPWWFGDPKQKKIHLWLRGLPLLVADNVVEPGGRVTTGGGSWRTDKGKSISDEDSEGRANRARVRSRTSPGLARAMADQWGQFAEEHYREQGRA